MNEQTKKLKWKPLSYWFPSADWSLRAQRSGRSWAHSWTCSGRSSAVGRRDWGNSDLLSRTAFGLESPAVRSRPRCGRSHIWACWRWRIAAQPCTLWECRRSMRRTRTDSCHRASLVLQGTWVPKWVDIQSRLHFLRRIPKDTVMKRAALCWGNPLFFLTFYSSKAYWKCKMSQFPQ